MSALGREIMFQIHLSNLINYNTTEFPKKDNRDF